MSKPFGVLVERKGVKELELPERSAFRLGISEKTLKEIEALKAYIDWSAVVAKSFPVGSALPPC